MAAELTSERIEVDDDLWSANAAMERMGWTDGLPVIPPTEERVRQMLAALGRDAQEEIGFIPPLWSPATVEKIAINAVMAGCLPEYMPVLIAAVEALSDPALNLYALQATTGGPAILMIAVSWGSIAAPMPLARGRGRMRHSAGLFDSYSATSGAPILEAVAKQRWVGREKWVSVSPKTKKRVRGSPFMSSAVLMPMPVQ